MSAGLRTQFPRTLIAVGLAPPLVAHIRQFVGSAASLESVPSVQAALTIVERTLDTCVLCPVPSERDLDQIAGYEHLHTRYPHVPIIAFFQEGASAHRAIMVLGRIGLTDLVSVDGELAASPLRQALRRAHALGVSSRVWDGCRPRLPDALVTLLKTALRVAHEPISTGAFAAAAQMSERSLRQYCEDRQLPSPQWIIGWARLLIAGYYLDEPGRTIAQVAELLQYPSACALRNQLRRYTGTSPRALRSTGATLALCQALEQSLSSPMTQTPLHHLAPAPLRLVR